MAVNTAVKESQRANDDKKDDKNEILRSMSSSIAEQQFSVLPTPNSNANSPHECYDIFEMFELTKKELDRYTSACATTFAETTVDSLRERRKVGMYPEYVCERLREIGCSSSGHKQKKKKFKFLSLIYYLITMYK